ncbi:MAG: hypothetical protein ACLP1E_11115 [Acidimicrobiales bacterium]
MIEGNRAIDVSRRFSSKDEAFLAGIATVACELHEGCRSRLIPSTTSPRMTSGSWALQRPPEARGRTSGTCVLGRLESCD